MKKAKIITGTSLQSPCQAWLFLKKTIKIEKNMECFVELSHYWYLHSIWDHWFIVIMLRDHASLAKSNLEVKQEAGSCDTIPSLHVSDAGIEPYTTRHSKDHSNILINKKSATFRMHTERLPTDHGQQSNLLWPTVNILNGPSCAHITRCYRDFFRHWSI